MNPADGLANLFRADALHRMRGEPAYETKKARHVRELGVSVESRLIHPLGVNIENQWIAQRLVEMDANATGLRARRLQKKLQFFAKLLLFSRLRLKANKGVYGQGSPRGEYSLAVGTRGGPERHPLFWRKESLQPLPFFFGEDHVVQWSVG